MKKFAYTIIVGDHASTVYSVAAATVFANKQIGCEFVNDDSHSSLRSRSSATRAPAMVLGSDCCASVGSGSEGSTAVTMRRAHFDTS